MIAGSLQQLDRNKSEKNNARNSKNAVYLPNQTINSLSFSRSKIYLVVLGSNQCILVRKLFVFLYTCHAFPTAIVSRLVCRSVDWSVCCRYVFYPFPHSNLTIPTPISIKLCRRVNETCRWSPLILGSEDYRPRSQGSFLQDHFPFPRLDLTTPAPVGVKHGRNCACNL